jgi:hypothetical protein
MAKTIKLNQREEIVQVESEEAYEKLKSRIEEVGVKYLFHYWEDKSGRKWIMDGHHRKKTLTRMRKEGYKLPEKYPAIPVNAKSKKDAAKELLHLNSNYGKLTKKGLTGYTDDFKIELDELQNVKIDELDKIKPQDVEAEKPELEFSHELLEEHNYLIFTFEDQITWNMVKQAFDVKPVKGLDYKDTYQRVGIGRVLPGKKLIDMLGVIKNV